jgi:hypothetical protein
MRQPDNATVTKSFLSHGRYPFIYPIRLTILVKHVRTFEPLNVSVWNGGGISVFGLAWHILIF